LGMTLEVFDLLDFALERGEEALGDRVVPAIALPAHAADDAPVAERGLVVTAGVRGGFNPSSQHLEREELRCENGEEDAWTCRVDRSCGRLDDRQQVGASIGNGSGRRSRGDCPPRTRPSRVVYRRPLAPDGSAMLAACHRLAWLVGPVVTCPSRSEKRSPSSRRRAPGYARSPAWCAEVRRRFLN
jgi:hypothetical protein